MPRSWLSRTPPDAAFLQQLRRDERVTVMKVLKWLGYTVLVLIIMCIPAYWWLAIESHIPSSAHYSIDMAVVRRMADADVADLPVAIRVETIGHLLAPETFVIAGGGWRNLDMPVSAYQIVYKDHAVIIDTAFNSDVAKQMGANVFDDAAYARLSAALATAQLIIVTHEHADHVGGLLAQPNLKDLMAKARLTQVQVTELKKAVRETQKSKSDVSPAVFDAYRGIDDEPYHTIAPGVVSIKAPGHTPGSQMLYVKRADGQEILFLGDVAWQMSNIEKVRERARLVTWLTGEDREAVMGEFVELHRLHAAEPNLNMMPGHDSAELTRFLQAGLLMKGF
jgi:glyoxylase-like metal-dependent hydrolase (beta-lactamase superfamily II)